MPLINTSVPNLIQGVSQQPDATRHAGQCEEQENALSSVVDGLKKRPNTRHVARLLTTAIDEDSFVHFINRDDNEKYVVIHDGTDIRVFNLLTGVEATINGATAKKYTPSSGSYLDISTPRNNLKALTIADNTFLLNNQKVVEKSSSTTDTLKKEAWVYIKQGDYNSSYSISLANAEGIQLNLDLIASDSNYSEYPPYEENTYRLSIKTSSDDYTPNTYIAYYKNQGDTTAIGYIYIGDSGAAVGLSETNNGTVVDYIDYTNYEEWDEQGNTTVSNYEINSSGVYISGSASSFTSSGVSTATVATAPAARSNKIAENLVYNTPTLLGNYFHVTQYGNGILYEAKTQAEMDAEGNSSLDAVRDFSILTEDSMSDTAMQAVYKSVQSITDLPVICKNGFTVKIVGDAELQQDDYYVKFETAGGETVGQGAWVETAGYGIRNSVSAGTLPMRLINTGVNQFTLETSSWDLRKAGDDDTNPFPSFVGNKLNNLFLYKNRLGFLSQDQVVLSEAGHYFNLFRTTVTSLLDSDLIDVSVSSRRVTNLQSAIGFQENLILFSDNSQFAMKGGDLLTPKTVSITPITNFSFEDQVDPLPLGSYIYFPFTRGAFTGMREFTVNATSDTYDSVEVTEHVPAYIPKNIIDMAGTTSEEMIALLSGNEKGSLYIYNYFWNNNQKVLSAWSKFTFEDEIRGFEFIESTLYMVTVDDQSNTHLLELPMEADAAEVDYNGNAAPFRTLVDKRVRAKITQGSSLIEFEQSNGTYSSANADLPYTYFNGSIPSGGATIPEVFVDSDGNEYALKYENIGSGGQVILSSGAATSTSYGYVGVPYTMKYKFSTQVFKASSGNSASPTAASSMQVRNGVLFFDDTHTFDVKVTPDGRSEVTETFSADDRPEATTLGNRKFAEGNFRFPVHSKAKNVEIVVENDSPFDSKFSSAEFESFVHPRSRRYG